MEKTLASWPSLASSGDVDGSSQRGSGGKYLLHSFKNVQIETIALPGTGELLVEVCTVICFSELSEYFSLTG